MKTILRVEDLPWEIKVEQREDKFKRFRVTYGSQVQDGLTYVEAAKAFGLCYFHALACEGQLNVGDGCEDWEAVT
jgi:hypothetical protein